MKALFTILFLATQIHRADAITWEFDAAGDAQGWTARESFRSRAVTNTLAHLRSEVSDGVWRIDIPPFERGRNPSLQLVSPLIGQDSGLFDRVEVRLRVVHTDPFMGVSSLHWTNVHNQSDPGWGSREQTAQGSAFWVSQWHTYTTDWQELIYGHLASRTFEELDGDRHDLVWEGPLDDIRIDLGLFPFDVNLTPAMGVVDDLVESADQVPAAVEIDWIRLTGVEELILGELPPPAVALPSSFGHLFNPPTFHPLEVRPSTQSAPLLGDVDGNGTIDLVAEWDQWAAKKTEGWLVAFGDGSGGFSHGYAKTVPTPRGWSSINRGDINRDGLLDLVVTNGETIEVLVNYGAEGFVAEDVSSFFSHYKTFWSYASADINGDGYEDMWVGVNFGYDDADMLVLLNDGTGQFSSENSLSLGPQMGFQPSRFIEAIGAGQVPGMLWRPPFDNPGAGYKTTHINAGGELEIRSLPVRRDHLEQSSLLRYVGDFDRDGDVDWATAEVEIFDNNPMYKGLTLGINTDDGGLEEMRLHRDVVLVGRVLCRDLNGDGQLDLVFVNSDFRHPGVVVHLGQEDGLSRQEGYYSLSGPGGSIAAGDLDGDGDIDIVVLESAAIGGGGVHVLLNTTSDEATAVAETIGDAQPVSFALGANYPNPFNPATIIPFTVSAGVGDVDLTIYNVLGQPVRHVWAGPLEAGVHRLAWDGRDGQGQSVAAGVYLVRLHQGDQTRTRKMVKLE